jgi:hypothetical protein
VTAEVTPDVGARRTPALASRLRLHVSSFFQMSPLSLRVAVAVLVLTGTSGDVRA